MTEFQYEYAACTAVELRGVDGKLSRMSEKQNSESGLRAGATSAVWFEQNTAARDGNEATPRSSDVRAQWLSLASSLRTSMPARILNKKETGGHR